MMPYLAYNVPVVYFPNATAWFGLNFSIIAWIVKGLPNPVSVEVGIRTILIILEKNLGQYKVLTLIV